MRLPEGRRHEAHAARFEALFGQYNQELRRFLRQRLVNASDVDDCLQETYLSIWKQEARGHLRDNPRGYLFITALNVARALWRKEKPRRLHSHTELSDHCDLAHGVESEKALCAREAVRLIGGQLERLKPAARTAFVMHHVDGMNFCEIADRLGVSTRTVERHMARALDHCRASLGGVLADVLE